MGSRGEAHVGGLGRNPVGNVGNKVPQKLTTFLGLQVYFRPTQNTSIFSYFNKARLPVLDCTLCRLDSTFWLDSSLSLNYILCIRPKCLPCAGKSPIHALAFHKRISFRVLFSDRIITFILQQFLGRCGISSYRSSSSMFAPTGNHFTSRETY